MKHSKINKDWIFTAVEAAKEAASAIMEIYATEFEVFTKEDRSPVTVADKASSKILVNALEKTGIPIISEEESIPDFSDRKALEYVWVVDPIDGTKEFIRKNGEFCICIALIHNGKSIFGLIASPTKQQILIGGPELGAYYFPFETSDFLIDKYKLPHLTINPVKTVAYSRSHLSERATLFILKLENKYGKVNYIKKGSALKFVDLALGKADFYPRLAPTMEWDIAAGQAIYEAVGGEVLDFSNFESLKYNKADLYNPYFIAKNKDLTI